MPLSSLALLTVLLANASQAGQGAAPFDGPRSDQAPTSTADLEEEGFIDPRKRPLPRRHRLRLGVRTHYVKLTRIVGHENGQDKAIRFHFAPILLDLGYQLQFLRYMMVRSAVHFGPNVANSRNAMPWVAAPSLHLGFQGRLFGVAAGYSYMVPFPALINATGLTDTPQPVIWDNHTVVGEVSFTSRIDRQALTFALGIGAVNTDLSHGSAERDNWWRTLVTFSIGFYFDGSIRRERAEAQQQASLRRSDSP